MDILEVRKVVSRIRSSLFKNSNSYSIGMLKSHFKGTGLQFKEHRVYEHGDDVRFIDWKMLAKTEKPYIKTFEEERNVEITVVIDASPTMFYGYRGISKIQASIEIASLLNLLANETQDFIRVLILGKEIVTIPKANGDMGITRLINSLEKNGLMNDKGRVEYDYSDYVPKDSKHKMNEIMHHLGKKRELVILSDLKYFLNEEDFKRVLFNKNVHCFQIEAPLDRGDIKPFLFSKAVNNKSSKWLRPKTKKNSGEDESKYKRVKKLNVDDRYLEEFIKEMM